MQPGHFIPFKNIQLKEKARRHTHAHCIGGSVNELLHIIDRVCVIYVLFTETCSWRSNAFIGAALQPVEQHTHSHMHIHVTQYTLTLPL